MLHVAGITMASWKELYYCITIPTPPTTIYNEDKKHQHIDLNLMFIPIRCRIL